MNTLATIRNLTALGALAFAMGCVGAPDSAPAPDEATPGEDATIGEAQSPIVGGSIASLWMQQRAVVVNTPTGSCTGTIISNTHVLTASHCKVTVGTSSVLFYRNSANPSGAAVAVTQVQLVAGVVPANNDTTDNNGNFADIAVLTLASAVPSTSAISPLAITYPGSNGFGYEVGRGQHNGNANPTNLLEYVHSDYYSSTNASGYFYTNSDLANPGDSGGPIYTNGELQGALWGYTFVAGAFRDEFTAVSFHLPFILNAINYTGSFSSISANTFTNGTPITSIATSDLRTCKLACMQTSGCVGFAFRPAPVNNCGVYSTLGASGPWSGATSGVR